MKLKSVISFALLILFSMSPTISALPAALESSTFLVRDVSLNSHGRVLKGVPSDADNRSQFELIVSNTHSDRTVNRLYGSPEVSINEDTASIIGDVSNYRTFAYRDVKSVFQKDEYLENIPVNERFVSVDGDRRNSSLEYSVDRVFDIRFDFDTLNANDQITRRDLDSGYTVFFNYWGFVYDVKVNETVVPHRVFGFVINTIFMIFETNSHQFVGVHRNTDKGFGNMLPNFVDKYLSSRNLENKIRNSIAGDNSTRPGSIASFRWVNLGYNETYDLNLFLGFYSFTRDATTLILKPTSDELSLNVGLSIITIESAFDEAIEDEVILGFEDDQVDGIQDEALSAILEDEGSSLETAFASVDASTDDSFKLPFDVYGLLISLFVILPITRVKKLKK